MNFLSLNVRGLGGDVKARWIQDIKVKYGINFIALQESKCVLGSSMGLRSIWGGNSFGAEWVDSSGLSGGIICLWDPGILDCVDVVKDKNYLIIKGRLKGSGKKINIANVYGPQDYQNKKSLWERLSLEMAGSEGLWCLLGDFNEVRYPEEKRNASFSHRCASLFNDFIFNGGLLEYSMKDRSFTWQSSNGNKLSKIDRVLVCSEFFGLWPDACLRALPKRFSDHCPLILVSKESNFGPKPFRIFDSWIGREGFDEAVRSAASSFVFDGPADLHLLYKFEAIRNSVKKWRNLMIKKEGEKEALVREELEEL
ncbi:uncharacterized protein LOC110876940 [Helianthus annuus]|uniref:uncharacterized protein LOC110876940 n=1 Tax=Helianthus annuus TaxID=4232 RepID=UPI000B904518|nr:uncharacterized protein LOC110876940 [Helianthus annuus]